MVPVQVGKKISYLVDVGQAIRMASGANVLVVREHRNNTIVRLILKPHEAGKGCVNEPSTRQNSRRTTTVERLFTDDSGKIVRGFPYVYSHKPSFVFSRFSKNSTGSGNDRDGFSRRGAPTTTASLPSRSRIIRPPLAREAS